MSAADPAVDFLHSLAAAVLRAGEPAALATRAAGPLRRVFTTRKTLILDVQFTGFAWKGQLVGGVHPQVLRAAGQLIMLRVSRVGFTPEAGTEDLRALFEAVGKTPAELAGEGITGFLARHAPRGVYLSTSTGEVYRPPATPAAGEAPAAVEAERPAATPPVGTAEAQSAPAAEVAASEAPAAAEATPSVPDAAELPSAFRPAADFFSGDGADLSDFELIDEVFPALGGPPSASRLGAEPGGARPEEPGSNDMYHFFRAVKGDGSDEEAEQLPALLRAADNPTRFDELAQATARAALRLVRSAMHAQAVVLLHALVEEAERPERTRIFREAAVQALRRFGAGETLQHLAELLQYGGQERERILGFFAFIGGEAIPLLETMLFRTADADLRKAIFRRLVAVEGMSHRMMARAMADPAPARTRSMLELVTLPDVDHEVAVRWLFEAVAHRDAAVRMDVARHAGVVAGRGGLRVLLDLLNDADRAVKHAAIQQLGALHDAAAVPFLSRILLEASDEELQLAAIAAVGKIGSPDALPALLGLVNRRAALFAGKKIGRVKTAAVGAIGRIPTPAARDVLTSLAASKDGDVAPAARRVLGTLE